MENLRIVNVQVNDSTTIEVTFTHNLTTNLTVSNVQILAETPNVPDSEILEIKVIGKILEITCQPLTPFAAYTVVFLSTSSNPFISRNGDAKVFEDGVSNRYLILGPLEDDNPVKNYLDSFLKDNIYDNENDNSIIGKYLQSLSVALSKSLYDVRQVGNENYLSFDIIDEQKVRGNGPFDRLNEEGAYQILRVGLGPSSSNANNTFVFSEFPSYPITLQKESVFETLTPSSEDEIGKFNINNLILNLSSSPVSRINSIIFTFNSNTTFTYNISQFGYQIKSSRYDQDFGFSYLQLLDNQIKLSENILSDSGFEINNILKVEVSYEFKDLGIVVNSDSVEVITIANSFREVIPPIINIFTLKHAPIVDGNNEIPTLGGISFVDPNSIISGAKHSAFLYELPFRLNALPASVGQYSIDYATGTVYVYGADALNDGTGPTPPLMSYNYRFTYKPEIDYVYDDSTSDLVALPHGSLLNNAGNVNFKFEKVLIPGVDYQAKLHIEELAERIENRLVALNVCKAKNSPITNVFRIYNETSGELYTIDRWNDDKIYFRYNNPPRVEIVTSERASFQDISNELLFVDRTIGSIFKILLTNNNIIAETEDGIGTSFNSSLRFSSEIFKYEKWFNRQLSESINLSNLTGAGDYTVDYSNGIIYVLVNNINDFNIGTASYKASIIIPQHPHLISVEDIYYQVSSLQPKNKQFDYVSFGEGEIIPSGLNNVDELFLNAETSVYQLFNGQVGAFSGNTFINKTTNQVKFVRGIFEYNDLINNPFPINFSSAAIGNQFNISVSSIVKKINNSVKLNGSQKIVELDFILPYISSGITYDFVITRISDGYNLTGTLQASDNTHFATLLLSEVNNPAEGELLNIVYTLTINNLSRIVVDYNRGDLYTDYTYVADEIIISYEYGDNNLDFRKNNNLSPNTQYYTSYKVGALRDALLKNFGTLVNLPELTNFDTTLNRERYRDALTAALTSFIQGPTVSAMKNIGKTISHIEPEIVEDIFQNWSLGNSLLVPGEISTVGDFQLLPGKFGNGVLIDSPEQTISFPINNNFRLEEGTFEAWVIPQWNGLDNDAELTFNILRNGSTINENLVFIGGGEYHPEINNGIFSLNKNSNVDGTPIKNKDGIFIYYNANDGYEKWYFEVIDGYVSPGANYKIKINSSGNFYNFAALPNPSGTASTFSGKNSLNINISDGYNVNLGWSFVSDLNHYLLDFGEDNKNRFSIFKDAGGYLNFNVFDKNKTGHYLSSNISDWKKGELHHIAASWKLNNLNNQDEMHLFLDGFEVPNIIRYGEKLRPYVGEPFRTVNPERFLGPVSYNIVSGTDLSTVGNSATVSISNALSSLGIQAGDKIFIDEPGFDEVGYTIISISGNQFILSSVMPATINNGKYSFNRTNFIVDSEINVASNITVSVEKNGLTKELKGIRAVNPDYNISKDEDFNDILTISSGVEAGSLIVIRTYGLNHRRIRKQYYVWGDNAENILRTRLPPPISLDEAKITKILLPPTLINSNNSSPTLGVYYSNNFTTSHPSNSQEGRTISVVISGTNVDFSIPVEVKIDGYSEGMNTSETLTFTDYGIQDFVNKYVSINFVNISVKPINSNKTFVNLEVREKYSITKSEDSGLVPVVKFSYQVGAGTTLYNDGNFVRDDNAIFSDYYLNNYLLIHSPYYVAGYYKIIGISSDRKALEISPGVSFDVPLDNFTNGEYEILNTTQYRTGLQNGFFTFEASVMPGTPYLLSHGFYELDYSTYTSIQLDPLNLPVYLGSDSSGSNQFNGIIDQVKIYSSMLMDTREGETIPNNQRSITKDFNSLKPLKKDVNTLMLIDFESFPFTNQGDYYINSSSIKNHFQSSFAVNENFGNSLVISDNPLKISNDGILDVKKEGTIEFWVNPIFDTGNDPNVRYYFDAFGAVTEEVVSVNHNYVKINGSASQILSVKLKAGDARIDYFAGGKLEIDSQRAIVESGVSSTSGSVVVSKPVLQVISVKITGDLSEIDYFIGGSIASDKKTIYLGKALPFPNVGLTITYQTTENGNIVLNKQIIKLNKSLPYQNSRVVVSYLPKGLQGDRISILKDRFGDLKFSVLASGVEYSIAAPTFWAKNTWHRVKASYRVNSGNGTDDMRLFVDGYEYSNLLFGNGIVFDQFPYVFGGFVLGDGYSESIVLRDISFKDPINEFVIGGNYLLGESAFVLFDNLRISNISRPIYAPYGEPIDVNYVSNLDVAFPVTQDLFTTYLINFDKTTVLNEDFAVIQNRLNGLFDFSINILDSFGIINDSAKVKEILEKLIRVLKPANSRVFIEYTR